MGMGNVIKNSSWWTKFLGSRDTLHIYEIWIESLSGFFLGISLHHNKCDQCCGGQNIKCYV